MDVCPRVKKVGIRVKYIFEPMLDGGEFVTRHTFECVRWWVIGEAKYM